MCLVASLHNPRSGPSPTPLYNTKPITMQEPDPNPNPKLTPPKGPTRTNAVAAGSVWETRMKHDQVKGGIKVFAAEPDPKVYSRRTQPAPERRKRKSWAETDKNPVHLRKTLAERSEAEEKVGALEGGEVIPDVVPVQVDLDEKTADAAVDVPECVPEEVEEEFHESTSENYNRMQNIVDLVMWRHVPRTAFVFGIGSFLLISVSYTEDLNFSLISGLCYLGLLHLAIVFIYKSFIYRGSVDLDHGNQNLVMGEEEAVFLIKALLPYINEVLIKLRALFSGDPSTTMKMGILLFVLARYGGQITVWTMARMAFFGVFTIPKLWSSYSSQLSLCGNSWVQGLRNSWKSCNHKKAAIAIIFTIIWNISSTMARAWAVFMLVVAAKYYQQCVVTPDWSDNNENQEKVVLEQSAETQWRSPRQRSVVRPTASNGLKRENGPRTINLRNRLSTNLQKEKKKE